MSGHALIIGGTRGLGRVVARKLAQQGHVVSATGRREPAAEDAPVNGVSVHVLDLTDDARRAAFLAESAARAGPFRYVVFCQRYRGQDDVWSGEFATTLTLTRKITEEIQDGFESEGDRAIVMVSSVFAEHIGEGQPMGYHVFKAGLNQMMRFLAVNLGRQGIRVNAVTPFTYLKDESSPFYLGNAELQGLYREIVPLGRMGTTDEIADVIEFLCSPKARYVSGQNIYVDGGLSAVWPENLARRIKGI